MVVRRHLDAVDSGVLLAEALVARGAEHVRLLGAWDGQCCLHVGVLQVGHLDEDTAERGGLADGKGLSAINGALDLVVLLLGV